MKYGELNLGQIEAIVNKLGGMEGAKRFLAGRSEVVIKEHIIDCDAAPFVSGDWKVEEHQNGGQFKFDASQIELYLSTAQKKDSIEGNKLRRELAGKPVLNANVLDYLLAHLELIPEDWKGKYVFFWGTVYRSHDDCLFVRYLGWSGRRWYWNAGWLAYNWNSNNPAVLRVS